MFDAQAGDEQASFILGTQAVQVVDRVPEFVFSDFKIFDQSRGVLQYAQDDLLAASVAFVLTEACGLAEKSLDLRQVGNSDRHGDDTFLYMF
ncbi:hypothetical protein D3C80_1465000 [compost metagenome]